MHVFRVSKSPFCFRLHTLRSLLHWDFFDGSSYWNRIQELPVWLQHLFVRVCHHHIAMEIIIPPLSERLVQMVKLTDCFPSQTPERH